MKKALTLNNPDDLLEAVRTARFAMVSAGFTIDDRSETGFTGTKGSLASTFVFGWLAGHELLTIQYVDGVLNPDGTAVIRVSRHLVDDALSEKYLGPPKLQIEFDASVSRIARALDEARLLARGDSQG